MLLGRAVEVYIFFGKIEKGDDFLGAQVFDPQKVAVGEGHGDPLACLRAYMRPLCGAASAWVGIFVEHGIGIPVRVRRA
ncbi:hypothetical protein GCM10007385_21840 [Tateyamaria omphalii]|nr:hypothetical protein GCM10007385_21840 [Tateyamaria omphalii]